MLGLTPRRFQVLGLTFFLISVSFTALSCSWTPQVRTSFYEGPEGSVWFISVPDTSFHASHPVEISLQTFRKVLQGLQRQQHTGLLQGLLAGAPTKQQLFSEEQISWLTPTLQKAFSHVTPEEQVRFQIHRVLPSDLEQIEGTMFFDKKDIVVSIKWRSRESTNSPKQNQSTNTRNPAGMPTESLEFTPERAVRKDTSRSWLTGPTDPNRLVLDYTMLDGERFTGSSNPVSPEGTSERPRGQSPLPLSEESPPPQQSVPTGSPPSPTPPIRDATDNQKLLEEIKHLKERLETQEAEIEALKRK